MSSQSNLTSTRCTHSTVILSHIVCPTTISPKRAIFWIITLFFYFWCYSILTRTRWYNELLAANWSSREIHMIINSVWCDRSVTRWNYNIMDRVRNTVKKILLKATNRLNISRMNPTTSLNCSVLINCSQVKYTFYDKCGCVVLR